MSRLDFMDEKKEEARHQIAELFQNISNGENNESCEPEHERSARNHGEICNLRSRFDKYLELTTIWFQSILGLNTSPSCGTSDHRSMSEISLNKLVDKVNEFRNFINENEEYLDFLDNHIESYRGITMNHPSAKRVLEQFKHIANRNINKLNLIMSDFRHLLQELGISPENPNLDRKQYHKNLKILDSLLRLIVLKHKPIESIYSKFN